MLNITHMYVFHYKTNNIKQELLAVHYVNT